jgi:hypothetical protein
MIQQRTGFAGPAAEPVEPVEPVEFDDRQLERALQYLRKKLEG